MLCDYNNGKLHAESGHIFITNTYGLFSDNNTGLILILEMINYKQQITVHFSNIVAVIFIIYHLINNTVTSITCT